MTGVIVRLKGVVGICFLTVVFMVMYRFVPNRRARILSQAPGALFSAVVLVRIFYLFFRFT